MAALERTPVGGACAANQVYYSLNQRAVEFDLLPWQQARRMPLMAYSPLDQGAVSPKGPLKVVADRLGATAPQVALARLIANSGVLAIPKAVQASHLQANLAAAALELGDADLAEIDRAFPKPTRPMSLPML